MKFREFTESKKSFNELSKPEAETLKEIKILKDSNENDISISLIESNVQINDLSIPYSEIDNLIRTLKKAKKSLKQ